jgi:hypothetical protein
MWKDYKETESIRTRPAFELNTAFNDTINGVFFYNGEMLVHCGTEIYKVKDGITTKVTDCLNNEKSQSFVYDGIFYFKDGMHYLKYDGTGFTDVIYDAYIPTTTIARKPLGGGTKYEDVNMLSPYRKNSFLADGASFSFFLDVMNIDNYPVIVTVNDEVVDQSEYTVDYAEGKIVFKNYAPDAPLTDGQLTFLGGASACEDKYLALVSVQGCLAQYVYSDQTKKYEISLIPTDIVCDGGLFADSLGSVYALFCGEGQVYGDLTWKSERLNFNSHLDKALTKITFNSLGLKTFCVAGEFGLIEYNTVDGINCFTLNSQSKWFEFSVCGQMSFSFDNLSVEYRIIGE